MPGSGLLQQFTAAPPTTVFRYYSSSCSTPRSVEITNSFVALYSFNSKSSFRQFSRGEKGINTVPVCIHLTIDFSRENLLTTSLIPLNVQT